MRGDSMVEAFHMLLATLYNADVITSDELWDIRERIPTPAEATIAGADPKDSDGAFKQSHPEEVR